jgi:probable HAF family extracellular repeat protein
MLGSTHIRRTLAVLTFVLVVALPARAQKYVSVQLLDNGADRSAVYGINATGQSVGFAVPEETTDFHSMSWFNGITTDLDGVVHFLLRHPYFGVGVHQAHAISNAGQVVGNARLLIKCDEEEFIVQTAYILSPAVLSDLGTSYPGDSVVNLRTLGNLCSAHDSSAVAISNTGHVVGWADRNTFAGDTHAFLVVPVGGTYYVDEFDNDTGATPPDGISDVVVDLGTIDRFSTVSSATGVNDSGVVVGYTYTRTNTLNNQTAYHAFRIVPQNGVWFVDAGDGPCGPCNQFGYGLGVQIPPCTTCGSNALMESLGTLGGLNSWARGINNAGVIVGESDTADRHVRAFRWENGVMTDLGTLGGDNSSASRINDNGDIVGWAETAGGERHAVAWLGGRIVDLTTALLSTSVPNMTLAEARDINEHGQIVGWGTSRNGTTDVTRAFMVRYATQAEIDYAAALEAGQIVGGATEDSEGTTTGGTVTNATGGGVTLEGVPGNVGDGTAEPSGGGIVDPGAEDSPATPMCGFGASSLLPLTIVGLCLLRRRR